MKLLFLQPGDYAEAFRRLAAGEPETYRDQRRSVDWVAGLAPRFDVTVVSMVETPYRTGLAPGLDAAGIRKAGAFDRSAVTELLDGETPDLFVCRTPNPYALDWARRRDLPTLPCFADIFVEGGPRRWWRNRRLARILARGPFPCIANHSLNASRSIEKVLGLPADRIIPWDWGRIAADPVAKAAAAAPPTLFYAGALVDAKGVADALEAVARLGGSGRALRFEIAGAGNRAEAYAARARALGLADRVTFLGLLPNDQVRTRMRQADIVVVPSRHSYPEGLPNTIYEALASRSPLVISDHPAFVSRFRDGEDCLVFPAGDSEALASALARLLDEPALYSRLSENSPAALSSLYVGMEWWALVQHFVDDPTDAAGWVSRHSLATLEGR